MRPTRRARRSLLAAAGSLLILAGLVPAAAVVPAAIAATSVFINELHYDNAGTDAGEAVEVAGPAGTDLGGWSIVLYNGSTGASYDIDALSGVIPNQQNGFGTVSLSYPSNGIQNGSPDAIALVDPSNAVVQFLSYEGTFAATNGPALGQTSVDIGVAETGSEPVGQSLRLTGTGTAYEQFSWAAAAGSSFGAVNADQTFAADAGAALSINDVSANEGNSGTTAFTFTVSLSAPAGPDGVTFDIATADGSASAATDYTAKAVTNQSIAAGETTYTFSVAVNGDTASEQNETFEVNVTNVTGATVTDDQGIGTILNDDTCGEPATLIHDIQGSGAASPRQNEIHTIEGVVVGDYQGSGGFNGYYVQEEAADADDDEATSEGIFVFSTTPVAAGDLVRVGGRVIEFNGLTELTSVASTVICSSGNTIEPTDLELPLPDAGFPERLEGMLIRLPQELVISEFFNYDRFGEIVLALPLDGEDRPYTPTAVDEPGAAANARAQANLLRRIVLDDGLNAQNPTSLRHPNGDPFALDNRFRGGDTVKNAVGVVSFIANAYRIQPTAPALYESENPRPTAPDEVGGSIRAGAMNTLNFFLTLDTTASDTGPGPCGANSNLDCRGADADQPAEFDRQRTKLVAALVGLDADIIGLNELENTPGVDPLGDSVKGLVIGVNQTLGAGTYDSIDTGVIGTDAIRVGLIYRPDKVTPVGDFKLLTSSVDPRFIDTKSRPVLAQTFEENATGARFTVAVNHLKSKGSDCIDVGDPDTGDGQGNCNQTRLKAAQALVDWLATDPTGSGHPGFLILGDLNSYAMEDPIDAIKAGFDDVPGTADDYTNLIARYQGLYAHSYVFDGQAGYLDHALGNAVLTGRATGAADWHINSDEPDVVDYDTSFKPPSQEALYEPNAYRASDHDPVVVGLEPSRCVFAENAATKVMTLLDDCLTDETIRVPNGWTFDGAGWTVTAVDPEGGHFVGAVVANAGTAANVTNVTITARDLADVCDGGDARLRGVLLEGAAGSVTNVHVVDLNQGTSGCQEGNGIEVRNAPFDTTGTDLALTIAGNVVTGYQKTGIVVNGSLFATVRDNVVTGWGPTGVIAQNGIQVGFGGSAFIRGNTVSGNSYTGPDVACGLLFYQADGVKQQANTLFANEQDLCNVGRGGGKPTPAS